MKLKILIFCLIFTSLLGYLEWGGNNKMFLFEAEVDILIKHFSAPASVIHPFILLPMMGQLLLMITLFQTTPNKILTFLGMGGIGILLIFMFVVGIIRLNFKITMSTMPFIIIGILTIANFRKNI